MPQPPLPGAKRIFETNNEAGTCAAYSQTWLALSVIGKRPLENPGIVQSMGLMKQVQQLGAGGSSLEALSRNGMTADPLITLQNATWNAIFHWLAQCPAGMYYITMKNPHHANACCITNGKIYYLEPQVGLFTYADADALKLNLPTWYIQQTKSSTNTEFKIYKVKATSTWKPAQPRGRRGSIGIGTHRR
jgi:hypothetical protein